jgi:hypothetical protein
MVFPSLFRSIPIDALIKGLQLPEGRVSNDHDMSVAAQF